jgi:hypothetical protein
MADLISLDDTTSNPTNNESLSVLSAVILDKKILTVSNLLQFYGSLSYSCLFFLYVHGIDINFMPS